MHEQLELAKTFFARRRGLVLKFTFRERPPVLERATVLSLL